MWVLWLIGICTGNPIEKLAFLPTKAICEAVRNDIQRDVIASKEYVYITCRPVGETPDFGDGCGY